MKCTALSNFVSQWCLRKEKAFPAGMTGDGTGCIRDWRIMLDIKPNSAFLSAWNSAHQVVNSAQNSAEILLWLLMLSRHFPTHASRKYLGTIQDSRYQDQVGQFCGNDAMHSLGPSN